MVKIEKIKYEDIIKEIGNIECCDEIKQHTVDKISYVKKYVENWLYVMTRITNEVYFIDCMSNAGIYKNGYFCSCIEVLEIFYSFAINHPDVNFHLLCNDYNKKRIDILNSVIKYSKKAHSNILNVSICTSNEDATTFINKLTKSLNTSVKKSVLIYVDPYNFVTNDLLDSLFNFTSVIYSELILNFFSSDVTRNIGNLSAYKKKEAFNKVVSNYVPNEADGNVTSNQLMYAVIDKFTNATNLKYKYVFQIKNSKNVEQYYLLYFTPNLKGLSKLKNTVWQLFGASKNNKKIDIDTNTYDLFGNTPFDYIKNDNLNTVKNKLNEFIGKSVSYKDIEKIVLESTIFTESYIIKYIIKPLINERVLIKQNLISTRNYIDDKYKVSTISVLKEIF